MRQVNCSVSVREVNAAVVRDAQLALRAHRRAHSPACGKAVGGGRGCYFCGLKMIHVSHQLEIFIGKFGGSSPTPAQTHHAFPPDG